MTARTSIRVFEWWASGYFGSNPTMPLNPDEEPDDAFTVGQTSRATGQALFLARQAGAVEGENNHATTL